MRARHDQPLGRCVISQRKEVIRQVAEAIVEQTGIDKSELKLKSSLKDDLKFDSLDAVDLVQEVEDRLTVIKNGPDAPKGSPRIAISDEEAEGLETFEDVIKLSCQKLGINDDPSDAEVAEVLTAEEPASADPVTEEVPATS